MTTRVHCCGSARSNQRAAEHSAWHVLFNASIAHKKWLFIGTCRERGVGEVKDGAEDGGEREGTEVVAEVVSYEEGCD